jgi:hypothetical protein
MRLSVDAGTLPQPVPYEQYVNERFAKAAAPAAIAI